MRQGRDRVAQLALTVFLVGFPFSAYVGLAPQIQADWNLGPGASAALYSAYLLGAALAAGLVLPRMPRGSPRVVMVATAVVAAGHLGLAVVPGPISGAVTRLLAGGAYIVVYYGAIQWLALVTAPSHRGRIIGLVVTAGYAGTSASYLLMAAVLAQGMAWRVGYALLSVPCVLGVAVAWLAFRSAKVTPAPADHSPARNATRMPLGGRELALVITGYSVHAAELYVARFWIPYALIAVLAPVATPASAAHAYLLSGLLFTIGVASPWLGGWSADRVGTGRAAGWILLAGAVLAGLLLWIDQPFVFVAVALAYCFLLPADSAVFTAGVTLYAGPGRLNHAQAIQAIAGFAAGAAAPALVGVLVESSRGVPGWRIALGANALIALVGAGLLFTVDSNPLHRRGIQL